MILSSITIVLSIIMMMMMMLIMMMMIMMMVILYTLLSLIVLELCITIASNDDQVMRFLLTNDCTTVLCILSAVAMFDDRGDPVDDDEHMDITSQARVDLRGESDGNHNINADIIHQHDCRYRILWYCLF